MISTRNKLKNLTQHYKIATSRQQTATNIANKIIESNKFPKQEPTIRWNAKPNTQYTILMYDPDAPAQPSWLHWAKVNITNTHPGNLLMSYSPPAPPSGIHRYIYALYKQSKPISSNTALTRANFNYTNFIDTNGLQLLARTIYKVKK